MPSCLKWQNTRFRSLWLVLPRTPTERLIGDPFQGEATASASLSNSIRDTFCRSRGPRSRAEWAAMFTFDFQRSFLHDLHVFLVSCKEMCKEKMPIKSNKIDSLCIFA